LSTTLSTLFTVIVFGIASNLDNLGVGIAYGIAGTRTSISANVVIAFVSSLVGGLSIWFGHLAANMVDPGIAKVLGACVLAGTGLWILLKAFLEGCAPSANGSPRQLCYFRLSSLGLVVYILKEPLSADRDGSGTIDTKEALSLGAALALNNASNGVPAGLMGLPAILTSLSMGLLSLFAIGIGWHLGRLAGSRLTGRLANMLSGAVLVGIAFLGLMVSPR
jgi:putative sporulation protein YtaF